MARDLWGRLVVSQGPLRFVCEQLDTPDALELNSGDSVVISPETPRRVEPGLGCRFSLEFHR